VRNSFSLGIAGYNDSSFCIKNVPNFTDKYQNGVRPSRRCNSYRYYTCHVAHYCNGDKQCEQDANSYWLPVWAGTENDLLKRIEFTEESCEIEKNNCNQGLKNDVRCRNLSSEKYQKIIKENQSSKGEVKK